MTKTPEVVAAQPDVATESPTPQPAADAGGTGPEDLLKKAEQAAAEHHDAWLRARAESDNIRKRAQAEVVNAHKFAVENFTAELLPVMDSLEAALTAERATVDSMKSGVELTLRQLKNGFDKFSVTEINPAGQKFDPHRHQAISAQESDAEPNTVVRCCKRATSSTTGSSVPRWLSWPRAGAPDR